MKNYNLTEEQAAFIRNLRTKHNYSWRAVARDFTEKYPEVESPTEKQMVGLKLCEEAMELLGESTDQGWN